jgi:hypothetical protein
MLMLNFPTLFLIFLFRFGRGEFSFTYAMFKGSSVDINWPQFK